MKMLFGCEESQACTIAMRARGHEAYSCDLLPCSGGHPEWHIQGDVIQALLSRDDWDFFFFFPTCTYITVSGLHWNKRVPGRAEKTEEALQFVARLWNLSKNIPKVGFENPIGCISTRIIIDTQKSAIVIPNETKRGFRPSQIIQPYQFGDDASKATCLWLRGLPILRPTKYIEPRIIDGKKRWANQTDSGQNRLGPSEDRAKIRSKTFPGIAAAMAEQWG